MQLAFTEIVGQTPYLVQPWEVMADTRKTRRLPLHIKVTNSNGIINIQPKISVQDILNMISDAKDYGELNRVMQEIDHLYLTNKIPLDAGDWNTINVLFDERAMTFKDSRDRQFFRQGNKE
jgi:hypothetical protein